MILSFINICKVPRKVLKTSGFALGFQHLPRYLTNVNEWKIMFDPYIIKTFLAEAKIITSVWCDYNFLLFTSLPIIFQT